jgi:hypothetical protein
MFYSPLQNTSAVEKSGPLRRFLQRCCLCESASSAFAKLSRIAHLAKYLRCDHPAGTLAKACPHSTQDDLWRGVINPQKGQILCDAKSLFCGFNRVRSRLNESAMKGSRRERIESRERKPRCIESISPPTPVATPALRKGRCGQQPLGTRQDVPDTSRMTRQRPTNLCRIAHVALFTRLQRCRECCFWPKQSGSEQFRPAIV